jgi:hypothetical protein
MQRDPHTLMQRDRPRFGQFTLRGGQSEAPIPINPMGYWACIMVRPAVETALHRIQDLVMGYP